MEGEFIYCIMACAICTIIICGMSFYIIQFLGDIEKTQNNIKSSIESVRLEIFKTHHSILSDTCTNQGRVTDEIISLRKTILDLKREIDKLPNNFTEEEIEIISGFAELLKKQRDKTN